MDPNDEILNQAANDKRLPDDAFRLVVAALKGQAELDAVSTAIHLERRVRELLPERWGQAHAVRFVREEMGWPLGRSAEFVKAIKRESAGV